MRYTLRRAKRMGFSDSQLARICNENCKTGLAAAARRDVRTPARASWASLATYHLVDTCAAEFEAYTPYLYSSYERASEARPATAARS